MNRALEWILVLIVASIIVGVFVIGGILLLPFMIVGMGTIASIWVYAKLSSLFRRSEATTKRERREGC